MSETIVWRKRDLLWLHGYVVWYLIEPRAVHRRR
jgi:hypothetical protein